MGQMVSTVVMAMTAKKAIVAIEVPTDQWERFLQ
jgi:hypothetical protein